MKKYLEAVTLGAFGFRGAEKAGRLTVMISALPAAWLWLHFFIVSTALNFPVMTVIAGLSPYEFFTRLFGADFVSLLPEAARNFIPENVTGMTISGEAVEGFNLFMIRNNYGATIMLPVLAAAFGVILILQGVFYLLATFCMGLQRMTHQYLKFRDRVGLLLFSSTLPVFLAALFGFWLPTVHIIVFYFAVILISFYRSGVVVHTG
ncbi:MAG: hypothetical protein LBB98_14900 [Treponema sp.]|jgi:hypothetical protein|nr:hypothetical protein [Treponema sp.]